MSEVAAVRLLGKAWRRTLSKRTTQRIIQRYLECGLGAHGSVQTLSFDALRHFLHDADTIARAKDCLQRIHVLCVHRHGDVRPRHPDIESVNARVFVAGFMIAYRPTHVFPQMGAADARVLNACTALMTAFERIVQRCLLQGFKAVPHDLTQDFSRLLFGYMVAFKEWKLAGDQTLSRTIGRALVAMDNARLEMLLGNDPQQPVLDEIRVQSIRLTKRLRAMIGEEGAIQIARAARCGSIRPGEDVPLFV